MSNLKSFDGGKKSMSEKEKALVELADNLPYFIELFKVKAKLKRQYYLHLVESGFSEEEALEIAATDPTI